MNNYLILIISALLGGFCGAVFAMYLPTWWFAPRLRIVDIDPHGSHFRLLVHNSGRSAAINASGRITIKGITETDVLGTKKDIAEIRKSRTGEEYWMETNDAYIRVEEWATGIEMEAIHWATFPSEMKMNINPSFYERLHFVYSDGSYAKIASENKYVSRTKLKLNESKRYYGIAIVSAENAKPSDPFGFEISLGDNGRALVKSCSARLFDISGK